ncbi:MAG TPA: LemA family protein [Actinomycetota bacterium]|nr:LemA family protein [Actinomycetota bacterium]
MDAPLATGRRRPGWLMPLIVIGLIALLVVMPLIGSYNSLVAQDEEVDRVFADLDAQLQRRADLIPNAVAAVRGALNQEQEVFGQLARARSNYAGARTPDEKVAAGNQMESAFARLLVVVESYPDLKSNDNIRDLMVELEGTENRINQSRRDYNGAAAKYNVSVRRFPRTIFAGLFGFERKPLFRAPADARQAPGVDLEGGLRRSPAP